MHSSLKTEKHFVKSILLNLPEAKRNKKFLLKLVMLMLPINNVSQFPKKLSKCVSGSQKYLRAAEMQTHNMLCIKHVYVSYEKY